MFKCTRLLITFLSFLSLVNLSMFADFHGTRGFRICFNGGEFEKARKIANRLSVSTDCSLRAKGKRFLKELATRSQVQAPPSVKNNGAKRRKPSVRPVVRVQNPAPRTQPVVDSQRDKARVEKQKQIRVREQERNAQRLSGPVFEIVRENSEIERSIKSVSSFEDVASLRQQLKNNSEKIAEITSEIAKNNIPTEAKVQLQKMLEDAQIQNAINESMLDEAARNITPRKPTIVRMPKPSPSSSSVVVPAPGIIEDLDDEGDIQVLDLDDDVVDFQGVDKNNRELALVDAQCLDLIKDTPEYKELVAAGLRDALIDVLPDVRNTFGLWEQQHEDILKRLNGREDLVGRIVLQVWARNVMKQRCDALHALSAVFETFSTILKKPIQGLSEKRRVQLLEGIEKIQNLDVLKLNDVERAGLLTSGEQQKQIDTVKAFIVPVLREIMSDNGMSVQLKELAQAAIMILDSNLPLNQLASTIIKNTPKLLADVDQVSPGDGQNLSVALEMILHKNPGANFVEFGKVFTDAVVRGLTEDADLRRMLFDEAMNDFENTRAALAIEKKQRKSCAMFGPGDFGPGDFKAAEFGAGVFEVGDFGPGDLGTDYQDEQQNEVKPSFIQRVLAGLRGLFRR